MDFHRGPQAAATRRGVVRCSIAAVLFGISAPLASRLAGELGAFSLAGLLYLGAAIAVLPVVGASGWRSWRVGRDAPRLLTAVVIGGAVGPVLLAAGLGRVPAATSSLLLNLELVFTTVVAYLFFKEHVGWRVAIGTAWVVVAGVILGSAPDAALRWGAVLIAAACLCWGIDNCVTATLDELTPSQITLAKGLIAGTSNLLIGTVVHGPPAGMAVVGALVVGAFGYGLSITLWVAGARDLGAARGQLVFATAPFVGAAVAWVVLAEPVQSRQLLSLVVAAGGVGFVLRSSHDHEHAHDAVDHDHEHVHDDGHHDHTHDEQDGETAAAPGTRHHHRHRHERMVHAHPHVPDLHHHHDH